MTLEGGTGSFRDDPRQVYLRVSNGFHKIHQIHHQQRTVFQHFKRNRFCFNHLCPTSRHDSRSIRLPIDIGQFSQSHPTSLISSHHTRAADDGSVSNSSYLHPGDPSVIAPSRSSSLRRTSSMTDLDEEFQTAVRRARDSKPGLGFGLSLVNTFTGDASPVTISSGSRLFGDVRVQ